jgi:peptide deformylase
MPARPILQLGNPLLRTVSGPAGPVSEVRGVLQDLRDTLHWFQSTHGFGRGISAIQIGEPKRLIYIEFEGRSYCLHDPEFTDRGRERFRLWDDCFSFPDLLVWLERHVSIDLRYRDEHGEPCSLQASGALSELIQHEMDHLDGILAVDRAIGRNGLCTRAEYDRRYAATHAAPPASE